MTLVITQIATIICPTPANFVDDWTDVPLSPCSAIHLIRAWNVGNIEDSVQYHGLVVDSRVVLMVQCSFLVSQVLVVDSLTFQTFMLLVIERFFKSELTLKTVLVDSVFVANELATILHPFGLPEDLFHVVILVSVRLFEVRRDVDDRLDEPFVVGL